MDNSVKVAVVRGDRRREAVAQALDLVGDDVRRLVAQRSDPILIPSLESAGYVHSSTHRDALSATLDALLAWGGRTVTIVGRGVPDGANATKCFGALGYLAESWNRPVTFCDLDSAQECLTLRFSPRFGEVQDFSIPKIVAESSFRVSLAVARTHAVTRVGLGLPNLANLIPRPRRGFFPSANLSRIWALEPLFRADHRLARLFESFRGRLISSWLALRSVGTGLRLTPAELRQVHASEDAADLILALTRTMSPALSLVDGFIGLQGQGPRHGRRIPIGAVVAGTDPVAVDAVSSAIMGFEPLEIAYLRRAHEAGLGTADMAGITVLGDPWPQARRRVDRHAADRLLRLASGASAQQRQGLRPHLFSSKRPQSSVIVGSDE